MIVDIQKFKGAQNIIQLASEALRLISTTLLFW